jgi:hypothetical protein
MRFASDHKAEPSPRLKHCNFLILSFPRGSGFTISTTTRGGSTPVESKFIAKLRSLVPCRFGPLCRSNQAITLLETALDKPLTNTSLRICVLLESVLNVAGYPNWFSLEVVLA